MNAVVLKIAFACIKPAKTMGVIQLNTQSIFDARQYPDTDGSDVMRRIVRTVGMFRPTGIGKGSEGDGTNLFWQHVNRFL